MTIGEVAENTGLSHHTLRFYEKAGLIRSVPRNKSGHRHYSPQDMEIIGFIIKMRAVDMPLKDIAGYIALLDRGEDSFTERLAILKKHKQRIEKRMQETGEILQFITGKIEWYTKHGKSGNC